MNMPMHSGREDHWPPGHAVSLTPGRGARPGSSSRPAFGAAWQSPQMFGRARSPSGCGAVVGIAAVIGLLVGPGSGALYLFAGGGTTGSLAPAAYATKALTFGAVASAMACSGSAGAGRGRRRQHHCG
jgi:hypothetical protein